MLLANLTLCDGIQVAVALRKSSANSDTKGLPFLLGNIE